MSEILRMKPVGQTRYNAGDILFEELADKKKREKLVTLNDIPDEIIDSIPIKKRIRGVNTSTFVLGTDSKTKIAWHIEDCSLGSINLHHGGHAKEWKIIPPNEGNQIFFGF